MCVDRDYADSNQEYAMYCNVCARNALFLNIVILLTSFRRFLNLAHLGESVSKCKQVLIIITYDRKI